MRVLCDNCLQNVILNNLSQEDFIILDTLYKQKTISKALSIEREKLISECLKNDKMTKFKFNMSIARLEICSLIGISNTLKKRYWLTDDGKAMIYILNKSISNYNNVESKGE